MGGMRRAVLIVSLALCLVGTGPVLAKPPHPNAGANNAAAATNGQTNVGTQQLIGRKRRMRRLLRRWRRIEHRRHRRWLRHRRWWLRHHHLHKK